MGSSAATEIERAISEVLAQKGISAPVVIRENMCELHADPVVAIDLGEWVKQWNLLPDDIRRRRAEAAAVRLTNALNQTRGVKVVPPGQRAETIRRVLGAALVLSVAGLIGWWLYRTHFFGRQDSADDTAESAEASAEPETRDEAAVRIRRTCEAGRQRLYQGADLGVDVEGWVVELWLARPGSAGTPRTPGGGEPLATSAALVALRDKGAASETGAAGPVAIELAADSRADGLDAVIVRFTGGYVPPFFTVAGRERFLGVAEKVADNAHADLGALFARCAHMPNVRDVGAWYRGSDAAGAAAALLYAAGTFADPPALAPAKVGGVPKLRELCRGLADPERDEILRVLGGRVTTKEKGSVSIAFPLGGPTRPAQASREIVKALKL